MTHEEIIFTLNTMEKKFAEFGATVVECDAEAIFTLTQKIEDIVVWEFSYSIHPSPHGLFVRKYDQNGNGFDFFGFDNFINVILRDLKKNFEKNYQVKHQIPIPFMDKNKPMTTGDSATDFLLNYDYGEMPGD